jgi:hypothetical protein
MILRLVLLCIEGPRFRGFVRRPITLIDILRSALQFLQANEEVQSQKACNRRFLPPTISRASAYVTKVCGSESGVI